jgi:hypothetical protein
MIKTITPTVPATFLISRSLCTILPPSRRLRRPSRCPNQDL